MASTSRAKICDLPDEELLCIFSFLPVAVLARCAATCERFHGIVTGFPHLWKDKEYRSCCPTECAEIRAVLDALPPLQDVIILDCDSRFWLSVSYPSLTLSDQYIGVLKDYPRLRWKSLIMKAAVPISRDVLSLQLTTDLEGLQELWVCQLRNNVRVSYKYSADYMVYTAMRLCPNLRRLRVDAYNFTAESLNAVQGFGQLQFLENRSASLCNLSFLWHCSGTLEYLQLLVSSELPPWEIAELSHLEKLRRLWLSFCRFEEVDLAAAMAGLTNLESLRLDCCSVVCDLSILKHCGRLRELHIINSSSWEAAVDVLPEAQQSQLHDLRLPTQANFEGEVMFGVSVTGNDLSAALRRLEELGLNSSCRAYLSAMCHCSQLRRLCCDFESSCDEEDIFSVRVYITLTGST